MLRIGAPGWCATDLLPRRSHYGGVSFAPNRTLHEVVMSRNPVLTDKAFGESAAGAGTSPADEWRNAQAGTCPTQ